MPPRWVRIVAGILLCLPFPAMAQEGEEGAPPRPALPRRCGICHLDRAPAPPAGRINFLAFRRDGAGERPLCFSCHSGPVRDSRRSIWRGRHHPANGEGVSCGSCHDPHVRTEGLEPFMKYRADASGYCLICHAARARGGGGEHPVARGGSGADTPQCGTCHVVHRAPGQALTRRPDPGELCAGCHDANPSTAGVGPGDRSHPSAGKNLSCLTCHQVHRAPPGERLVNRRLRDGTLCGTCHESQTAVSAGGGSHPVGQKTARCLTCHRAHNAVDPGEKAGLLRRPLSGQNALCLTCHETLDAAGAGWNHPVDGRIDDRARFDKLSTYGSFVGPEGEVLCLSCHRAHGGLKGTPSLVIGREAICLYCHVEENSLDPEKAGFGTHPVSARPRTAVIAATFLKKGGVTGRAGEIICLTCHRIHHGEQGTRGLVLSPDEYSCTLCHTDKAEIAGTGHDLAPVDGEIAGGCRSCHGEHGWTLPLDEVQVEGTVIDKVCWSCHGPGRMVEFTGFFGHTMGVPPSRAAVDLPLYWRDGRRLRKGGVITCGTCHDVHRDPAGDFLRLEPGKERSTMCLACHPGEGTVAGTKHDIVRYFPKEKNRRGESAEETGTCGACHVVHSSGPGGVWARETGDAVDPPDVLAAFCSDCHREGYFAQGKIVAEKSHPASALPGRVRLRVGCDGCHDPHTWNPADPDDRGDFFSDGTAATSFLVRPAGESAELCLGCHPGAEAVAGTPHDLSAAPGTSTEGAAAGLCGSCHVPHGGDPVRMRPAALTGQGPFGEGMCRSCHPAAPAEGDARGYDHPVGVNVSHDIGEDVPLYSAEGIPVPGGKVGCGTCHDPHRWSPVDAGEGEPASRTSFLRAPADGFSPLCFPCHAGESLVVGTDHDLRVTAPGSVNAAGETTAESGVCGSCHRIHGATKAFALWNRDEGVGEDPPTRYCRSCHSPDGAGKAKVPERMETHLVSYPGKGLVSRIFTLKQRTRLDLASTIELVSAEGEREARGYVSCGSCHDVHLWEPGATRSGEGRPVEGDSKNSFLLIPNTFTVDRAFCRECHGDETLDLYLHYHWPAAETEEGAALTPTGPGGP